MLFSLNAFEEITEDLILSKLSNINSEIVLNKYKEYNNTIKNMQSALNRILNAEEFKHIKAKLV